MITLSALTSFSLVTNPLFANSLIQRTGYNAQAGERRLGDFPEYPEEETSEIDPENHDFVLNMPPE
jgi:hypothetical protein